MINIYLSFVYFVLNTIFIVIICIMTKDSILNVQGREILLSRIYHLEYISITDMAKDFGVMTRLKIG